MTPDDGFDAANVDERNIWEWGTSARSAPLGCAIWIKVIRCMRSFSASSIRRRIQPLSVSLRRRHRKCVSVAPTIPGTAATVSSTTARWP